MIKKPVFQYQDKTRRIVDKVIAVILKHSKPEKIMLFGSRARGDNGNKSDFDFAVMDSSVTEKMQMLIRQDMEENQETLLRIDILWFDELNKKMKESVVKEGVVVYAK